MTKAECFQELIKKVLGRDCELAPKEGNDIDIPRTRRNGQRTANSNVDRRLRCGNVQCSHNWITFYIHAFTLRVKGVSRWVGTRLGKLRTPKKATARCQY